MTGGHDVELDLDDIQSGALHERPSPYVGTYVLLRIQDRAAGRDLVRRLLAVVDHGQPSAHPKQDGWITVAFTYQGLKALGVPQESLDSSRPSSSRGWLPAPVTWAMWARVLPSTGSIHSVRPTSTSPWRPCPRTPPTSRPLRSERAEPTRRSRAWT